MFAVLKEHQKRLLQKSKKKVCSFLNLEKKSQKHFSGFQANFENLNFNPFFGI